MSSVHEILTAAEDNINTIVQHVDNAYLRNLLDAAYLPEKKLKLPSGVPPYKINAMHEGQVSPGVFWQICRKLDVFNKVHDKLTSVRVETNFIHSLESLSAQDSKVLIAVKEQNLHTVFKGLTYEKLKSVGYFK